MTRLLLPLAALAIAGVLLPTGIRPAYACSCTALIPQQHVDNADVIVIGTVVQLIDTSEQFPAAPEKSEGTGIASITDVDAVVAVERYLKGTGPAQVEVDDPPSGGTCGFFDQASLGKRYLLFLTGETSPFQAHLCSGSTLIVDDQFNQQFLQDVKAITGPGVPPATGTAPPVAEPGADFPWLPIILGSSLGASALIAASAFLLRRRLTRS